ncbi:hypothetical protein [Geodermatophilus sp. CPCC 205761]|uniref:hypothetical protein n=2 Tax=unclassified Geodermatophilus TaxID=2637632 RepID=UPI003EEB71B6
MDIPHCLADFGDWAFDRHANPLSWYIRPLFLLPLAWFAYRRSGWGMACTLVALASSIFWFPAPAQPDPQVLEFLDFERKWLTGNWNAQKTLLALVAPLSLAAFCLAFWKRSVGWGLVILNLMAGAKLLWGVVSGDGTGWAMTAPALVGLVLGDVAFLWALRRLRERRHGHADQLTVRPVVTSPEFVVIPGRVSARPTHRTGDPR